MRPTAKLDQKHVADPLNRTPDPWADFREIELIELHWEQHYRHSLGKYSRFFLELEQKRLVTTRCPHCGKTWLPPRPLCPDDWTITQWVELSGRGTLVSWSVLHYPNATVPDIQPPYILAYVQLEGVDTLFPHLLHNVADPSQLAYGQPVHVVYPDEPVAHPIRLMAFALDA
jgi:uncharacterized OB-fold protein